MRLKISSIVLSGSIRYTAIILFKRIKFKKVEKHKNFVKVNKLMVWGFNGEVHHLRFPVPRKSMRCLGLHFWISLWAIFQLWSLSKNLKICLRFLGCFLRNWVEMWYSAHLTSLSLSKSKASNNSFSIYSRLSLVKSSGLVAVSTFPTHFWTMFNTK